MKNITLLGINSKFVHTNLAIRYIKKMIEQVDGYNLTMVESSINNQLPNIIREVVESKPEILLASTYIWNKEFVFKTIVELKKINPNLKIYLGGPEVSYNAIEIMKSYEEVDGVIEGEGEQIITNLLKKDEKDVLGLYYRNIENKGEIKFNGHELPIENLDMIPFPYENWELVENKGKIFYYESTRGCPFRCSYCMSSIEKSVRSFSIPRVKKDLMTFLDAGVNLVKFVDRTFNLKKEHYMEVWKFLIKNYRPNTTFHFEISADLFDDEVIEFLTTVPKDLFQFEIGVQTINDNTMKLIRRKNDLGKLSKNVLAIKDNIHLHLDLIAGLPKEDFKTFKSSFNYVYGLKPEMIQLGFLKILRGTEISGQIEKFEYKYMGFPPYEVISNDHITYEELLKLKDVEEVLDFYYNSGDFVKSIDYLINNFYSSPFEFYLDMANSYEEKGYFKVSHKKLAIFNFLLDFYKEKKFGQDDSDKERRFIEYLKFDYINLGKPGKYPEWFISSKDKNLYHELVEKLVVESKFKNNRQGFKNTEMEEFEIDIFTGESKQTKLLFIYEGKETKIQEC
ncbi:MAG: B12-binding domain-containing radical SAM protein [Psychrilyobacter sp.]|uniref:B12-binding domain-containing radical SAM protein n=1 Tax=Psychrilyobacter sp. TaxID=2586924 RepID=UPI003C711526